MDNEDIGGLFFLFIIIIVFGFWFGIFSFHNPLSNSKETFTILDKDGLSVYTSNGEIYFSSSFQLKRIELNKTYSCEKHISSISNCSEVI